jgi:sulfoacetaldehyde dehydrogenase
MQKEGGCVMMAEKAGNASEYVSGLIKRAKKAQEIVNEYTQEKIDELVASIAWEVVKKDNSEKIAWSAVVESELGNYDSKYIKLQKKIRGALRDIKNEKSVGIIETNTEKGIVKIAKPVGVIGAILPCTNPEATPVIKAMFAIKGRNAIILAPHPRTKKTNKLIADMMRDALRRHGAPEDLIVAVEEPTVEVSNEVMKQCDLIVATGGGAMVKAAYCSGKPAYGVGVGNAVVVVDETADLKDAANKIMQSKTFDYASSCSSDNSVVIQEGIYDRMIEALKDQGGYLVNMEEKEKLKNIMWINGVLNRNIVAQPPSKIASMAGINVGDDVKFIMIPETGIGRDFPFSGEKLSVVLALYKYGEFGEAIRIVNEITSYMGKGHSCGIHSFNEEHIKEYLMKTRTSRIMVRQATCIGNSGSWDNGMPFSLTLGCGTWGGNISSENITWKHMINTTWVSYPIEPVIPDDEDLFGHVMYE